METLVNVNGCDFGLIDAGRPGLVTSQFISRAIEIYLHKEPILSLRGDKIVSSVSQI